MTPARSVGPALLALMLGAAPQLAGAQDLVFPPGEDPRFDWASFEALKQTDLSGQTLSLFGPWLGPDKARFDSVIAYFAAATGADVRYSGSDSFEQQIVIDTGAGSPPDIAIFPQPGLAADLARRGHLVPLGDDTRQWVLDNYAAGPSWVALGTYEGPDGGDDFYALLYKVDVKSLVWFVPENFEDAGYGVPATMEELKALTRQIAQEGATPWCIGLGAGAATGWPATDWVEDLMLRLNTPEDYDAWTRGDLPFDDPKVLAAIEEFGWFARNDDFVQGGAGAVAATDYRDSPKGLFASPPRCYMHRQASFIPIFFPEGVEVGLDADFFYFPAYAGKGLGTPVLGAGTAFAITRDTPAARAFIEFLKTPLAHEIWMAQSGFLTPLKTANAEVYGDPTLRKMSDILLSADTFRFDGSDLMPGAVGAGAFWTGMIDYVGGADAAEVGAMIRRTWDSLN